MDERSSAFNAAASSEGKAVTSLLGGRDGELLFDDLDESSQMLLGLQEARQRADRPRVSAPRQRSSNDNRNANQSGRLWRME